MSKISGVSTWTEKASADNAVATATHAAVAGARHYITGVSASLSGATSKLLQIKSGTTVIFEIEIIRDHYAFSFPIECGENEVAEAVLAASGTAGQLGKVNIQGFTA